MASNENYNPDNDDVFNQDVEDEHVNQIIGGAQKGDEPIKNEPIKEEELPPVETKEKKAPILPVVIFLVILLGAGGFIVMKKQNDLKAAQQAEEESRMLEEQQRIEESQRLADEQELADLEAQIEAEENQITAYTESEVNDLYSLGFKKEQIKQAEKDGLSYADIKKQIETKIKKRYFDLQKEAYENTENLYRWTQFGTWLTYPDSVSPEKAKTYSQSCKYEKVPPYGFQTQLCIYLNVSNEYERYYLTVDPIVYESLKDSDFITVKYSYRYDKGMGQYWIYDMKIDDDNATERLTQYIIDNNVEID